jgi:alpha-methylacyl-CoA racemase
MTLDIGTNALDGGAPFFQVYETRDGRYMAVGAMEPKFYAQLLEGLGIVPSSIPQQYDASAWPEMIQRFAKVFKERTRDEWADVFLGKDACVTPVLELDEVGEHPHNKERDLLVSVRGMLRPALAPRP